MGYASRKKNMSRRKARQEKTLPKRLNLSMRDFARQDFQCEKRLFTRI